MKKIIMTLSFTVFLFINFVKGQLNVVDSVYLYDENGLPEWYYVQKDVFCFALTDNSKYTGTLPPCVDTIVYYQNAYTQFNEIHFKPSSPQMNRLNCVNDIASLSTFKLLAPALSKTTNNYTAKEFFQTNDLLMISFNDPNLSDSLISEFAERYALEVVFNPKELDLPEDVSWAYTFKMQASLKDKYRTSVGLAKFLNEEETALVKYADPDTYTVKFLSCEPTNEMLGSFYQNTNGAWYLNNDGGVIWNGKSGMAGADSHICECWGEGVTGQGIKIGVIDHGGFQFSHPDFVDANIPYAYNAGTYPNTNINNDKLFDENEKSSHIMNVTGVIAAQPNNRTSTSGFSVGGAYNATIIPYLCGIPLQGGDDASKTANRDVIHKAILRAINDKCDVLNMSFTVSSAGTLSDDIYEAVTKGRPDPSNPNIKRGIVVVAGTGNGNCQVGVASTTGCTIPFPANQPSTIGVGWTNPDDYRASPKTHQMSGGSWGITSSESGSVYGKYEYLFDVVAPGMFIRTTDLVHSTSNGYIVARGASLATPVVSSIAAMILEKRPDLTYQQVREIIRNGADKPHNSPSCTKAISGDTCYYYESWGYNNEMFYGRVNCFKSLKIAETLGVQENTPTLPTVIRNNGDGTYVVYTPQNEELKQVIVYDLSGKLLLETSMRTEVSLKIDLTPFDAGIYLLKVYDTKGNYFSTKLVR
ncbi:MAG TPA: S8 family serine peptidase [Crocinitomicaceae bacterium]|nr:S8 family serine peptidase [Crocinitomicaceae bacterium]